MTFSKAKLQVRAELPTSAYLYPGPAVIEVGCYEFDLAARSPGSSGNSDHQ